MGIGPTDSASGGSSPEDAREKCVLCGVAISIRDAGNGATITDANVKWTPSGYQHEVCPTPLIETHPSGFTQKQVYYAKFLVDAITAGGKVNLMACKDLKTGEDVTVLAIVGADGHGVTPIARMFEGDGTDEVEPVMLKGEKPAVMGRKTNG